ncbi:MAG: phosphoadenosine phosphosulfate reductase family protein [Cellulosilyticaceae bacterium]
MYIQNADLKIQTYEFHQRKYLPWELKLHLTTRRIQEWYDNHDGMVYVSFSGGLDSTVLLHFVRSVLGDDIPAVFSNTGLEYPELVEFVKTFDNVTILRPEMPFTRVVKEYGYPVVSKETAMKVRKLRHGNLSDRYRNYLMNGDERGKLGKLADKWKILIDAPFDTSEKCCDIMKKKPFKKYHKETGEYPFIGTTQDEGMMRERKYNKTGCNVYDGSTPRSQPLGFWTKQDVLRYAVENNLKIASVYGAIEQDSNGEYYTTGEQRTGCMFCGFGCHLEQCPNRFQRMAKTHPKQYQYCMDKLGLAGVLDYIGVDYRPEVEQLSLF